MMNRRQPAFALSCEMCATCDQKIAAAEARATKRVLRWAVETFNRAMLPEQMDILLQAKILAGPAKRRRARK